MFTPFGFRSAPAWGGVALMPFVLMQFTFALKVCLSEAAINMGIFLRRGFQGPAPLPVHQTTRSPLALRFPLNYLNQARKK
ncbi:MAG: hypothetical protein PHT57_08885 [Rhodoferax sp.]|jgi:hypothetical protein|nr:hypothetical protein [Rhodoferax sp.]